ncbi:hypothetical protein [Marilutibacter aestuarii]|uniref:Uncharacterized protein n=1 Tax=Marilutibacter aestuarii TaxID=1706195 RepID=A0A508AA49_9GAMM|nr:hypothetical protein [Lysobacter aestuarii]TQD45364.1 hypothetical protein FKV25_08340 [Lysobacter aestuarii]
MIFAVATDEATLMVFPGAGEAIGYCEAIDVEDGGWLFWDETGTALAPRFFVPNHRGPFVVGGGRYDLVPAPHLAGLDQDMAAIRQLEANPYFPTLEAVESHLANKAALRRTGDGLAPPDTHGV